MKKILKILMYSLITLMAIYGCSKREPAAHTKSRENVKVYEKNQMEPADTLTDSRNRDKASFDSKPTIITAN